MMTAINNPKETTTQLTGWEMRERIKSQRQRGNHTISQSEHSPRSPSARVPPAFRSILKSDSRRVGHKNQQRHGANLSAQFENKKMKQRKVESEKRKSSILESLSKYTDSPSTCAASIQLSASMNDDASVATLGTYFSLGSQPPVRNPTINTPTGQTMTSLDLSTNNLGVPALDEQWARFKLLGRVGLGSFCISEDDPNKPLIDKNVAILCKSLTKIMAMRDTDNGNDDLTVQEAESRIEVMTGKVLDEVRETISLPLEVTQLKRDPDSITLSTMVIDQLRDYVTVIASMYRDNPFHNFEHASHVLNALNKLLSLVTTPDDIDYTDIRYGCGVTNDPLTQFALVFSALVHDVDHAGVPNAQLIKERSHVAGAYKNKSVAEQNSIELAWNLLMEPDYKELRDCIYTTPRELSRFRGLVVTAVMATDIADKELAALRKGRAAEAMQTAHANTDEKVVRRRATFVMETLIQAADVSHTMGPFQVYRKWNHKLYKEMQLAYKAGRAEKDPADGWYKGDIGFFDFYIIPLAKKLQDCGIFQKASQDFINRCIANRNEWEEKGLQIVEEYISGTAEEVAGDESTLLLRSDPSLHSSKSSGYTKSTAMSSVDEKITIGTSEEYDSDSSSSSESAIMESSSSNRTSSEDHSSMSMSASSVSEAPSSSSESELEDFEIIKKRKKKSRTDTTTTKTTTKKKKKKKKPNSNKPPKNLVPPKAAKIKRGSKKISCKSKQPAPKSPPKSPVPDSPASRAKSLSAKSPVPRPKMHSLLSPALTSRTKSPVSRLKCPVPKSQIPKSLPIVKEPKSKSRIEDPPFVKSKSLSSVMSDKSDKSEKSAKSKTKDKEKEKKSSKKSKDGSRRIVYRSKSAQSALSNQSSNEAKTGLTPPDQTPPLPTPKSVKKRPSVRRVIRRNDNGGEILVVDSAPSTTTKKKKSSSGSAPKRHHSTESSTTGTQTVKTKTKRKSTTSISVSKHD